MKKWTLIAAIAGASLGLAGAAHAGSTVSGSRNGVNWAAQNAVVGTTSTATAVAGGNPVYFANQSKNSGVVTLIMQYDNGNAFICTGSAIGRQAIATAGHCVSDGYGTANPAKVTAYFTDSTNPELVRYDASNGFAPVAGVTAIDVTRFYVNEGYTGEVIDPNDIAILRLASDIPSYAKIYDLYTGDLTGTEFNVVGNGQRSDTGGSVGKNLGVGRMRQGNNNYDFSWDNAQFGNYFTQDWGGTNYFGGQTDIGKSYVADFDSGLAANDSACIVSHFATLSNDFCNTGLGLMEVQIAPGDSGGPGFVNGQLSSITSYYLTFWSENGDVDDVLNASFGEFSGYVPINIHESWIRSTLAAVPEPQSWAMMIVGFGMVGAVARRRAAKAHA